MTDTKFVLERKGQADHSSIAPGIMLTPEVGAEDYWAYRVVLSERQAVVGFPKFGTIGIGFLVEEDWNTNLPWSSHAENILVWICHNKGDDSIEDSTVLDAIKQIQQAVAEDKGTTLEAEVERINEFIRSQGRTPDPRMTRKEALAACIAKREQYAADEEED